MSATQQAPDTTEASGGAADTVTTEKIKLSALNAWPAGSKIEPAFQSCFNIDEVLRSNFAAQEINDADPDFNFRQSLLFFGTVSDLTPRGDGRAFCMLQDKAQQQAVAVELLGRYELEDKSPLIPVSYFVGTRGDEASLNKAAALMKKYKAGSEQEMSIKEQSMLLDYLEENSKKINKRDMKSTLRLKREQGKHLSFVSVVTPPKAGAEKKPERPFTPCANTACSNEGRKRCVRCKSAHYCSSECQKVHWNAGHKAICKEPKVAAVAGVEGKSVHFSILNDDPKQFSMTISRFGTFAPMKHNKMPTNPYGENLFLVKVQVKPMNPAGPLLIYDKLRTFQRYLELKGETEDVHLTLLEAVLSRPEYGGLKAYFSARREGASLRIYTEPLPSQAQNW